MSKTTLHILYEATPNIIKFVAQIKNHLSQDFQYDHCIEQTPLDKNISEKSIIIINDLFLTAEDINQAMSNISELYPLRINPKTHQIIYPEDTIIILEIEEDIPHQHKITKAIWLSPKDIEDLRTFIPQTIRHHELDEMMSKLKQHDQGLPLEKLTNNENPTL